MAVNSIIKMKKMIALLFNKNKNKVYVYIDFPTVTIWKIKCKWPRVLKKRPLSTYVWPRFQWSVFNKMSVEACVRLIFWFKLLWNPIKMKLGTHVPYAELNKYAKFTWIRNSVSSDWCHMDTFSSPEFC